MHMPERTSYPNGVPSWVDLASADVDKSVAFYGDLFGWDYAPAGPVEETGGYGMFTLHDKLVSGIGPLQNEQQPPVWSTYIAVDDTDATSAMATEAGGQIAVPAMDVMDAGRMAILIDPDGAFVGIWQAARHTGAQLVNEPGTLGWNELQCKDRDVALPFYETVFGHEPDVMSGEFGDYTVLKVGGKVVGGLIQMNEMWPEGVPPHWHVYFVVADADATATLAKDLGGLVDIEPFDAPGVGRMSMLSDSNGTHFSIIALAGEAD
jgi:predicted enzyme related to lactoylglutathione lyase